MFDAELRTEGWAPGTRLPRTSATRFAAKLVWSTCMSMHTLSIKAGALRRWHPHFANVGVDVPSRLPKLKHGAARPPVENGRRRRRLGLQGTGSIRCAWVREAVYQWFVSIR